MTFALIKTFLLLGAAVVLATAGPLMETDNEEKDTANAQAYLYEGCQATLYEHPNFVGRSIVVREQNIDFANDAFDNQADSIKIDGPCSYIFYENPYYNYQNWHIVRVFILSPGHYSTAPQGAGDMISSARALPAPGPSAIALFEHPYYSGAMLVLQRSHSFLPNIGFHDKISSEIVTGGSWTLFDQVSFTGASVTRTTGYHSHEHQLMDRINSVRKND